MRVAVVGTHGSGKTTLVEDFLARMPGYGHEAEPFLEMADLGTVFADPPDFDDFVAQAEFAIGRLHDRAGEADVIFDRSPLDLLAYAGVVGRAEDRAVPDDLAEAATEAMRSLGLVAFLPLSEPDEIAAAIERPKLRARVDRRLKALLRDDEGGLFDGDGPRLVGLRGPPARRLAGLVRAIGA